jgi:hypothetical protein
MRVRSDRVGRGVVIAVVLAASTSGCAPEGPRERPVELTPEQSGASGRPAEGTAPTARSRPEFLARDSVCRRAVVAALPACAGQWDAACDRELLAAAYGPPKAAARTGACYYHDRVDCPACACDFYVKVHRQGYDGGTGCLGTPEDVLRVLYGECAAQRCERRQAVPGAG